MTGSAPSSPAQTTTPPRTRRPSNTPLVPTIGWGAHAILGAFLSPSSGSIAEWDGSISIKGRCAADEDDVPPFVHPPRPVLWQALLYWDELTSISPEAGCRFRHDLVVLRDLGLYRPTHADDPPPRARMDLVSDLRQVVGEMIVLAKHLAAAVRGTIPFTDSPSANQVAFAPLGPDLRHRRCWQLQIGHLLPVPALWLKRSLWAFAGMGAAAAAAYAPPQCNC